MNSKIREEASNTHVQMKSNTTRAHVAVKAVRFCNFMLLLWQWQKAMRV